MTELLQPGAASPAQSQVTIADRLQSAAPASRPFVIDSSPDTTGTATGNAGVESYCSWPPASASRYQLNRPDHNQIFHFDLTTQGITKPTYCLDKFKDGPYGDVPYQNAPFETLFPNATARQKAMLAWILANAYPTVSAADTFALLGVDANAAPALDDNDAYAAVQVAIWVLLGQIAPDEVQFLDCGGTTTHPKSARLRTAVLQLLQMAGGFADAVPAQTTGNTSACRCGSSLIQCCAAPSAPGAANDAALAFRGCPCEVRPLCGRLLVGPFTLSSNVAGTPSITLEPFCACSTDLSADFTDFCGTPITAPGVGQEFYLALRFCGGSLCFSLNATLSGTVTRVLTMDPNSTALNYQPIGATLEDYAVTLTASLCVCITIPSSGQADTCVPGIPGFSGVYVQNNNNNNNNNNSNNNGNNAGSGFPPIVLPPCYLPGWPSPYPPYPPYPFYPPRPPYPPYPPYPPEPPCPPYPPYPPQPPCPPEPPCPPQPPCPPECPCVCPPEESCRPGPCCLPLERRTKGCRPRRCRELDC